MYDPQHIIVLMLENRSFDHMLGYLPHPNPAFNGLAAGASNPAVSPLGTRISSSPSASKSIEQDPAHDHDEVLEQLTGQRVRPAGSVSNEGFVASYERKAAKELGAGAGARIMGCQSPGNVPVLSTLALQFAVFDHWFCAVPGATWPNRHFALAGTSDGQVDIKFRPYRNRTVFEALEQAGLDRPWRVYHDGIPQVWSFVQLLKGQRKQNFRPTKTLFEDIAADTLPKFALVEPKHFGRNTNSQHPGNNSPEWFRSNPGRDFDAAERLIADIYTALLGRPAVFEKTLFLITYDEHGGFFDHVPPPRGAKWEVAPDDHFVRGSYTFPFDLLGPRVPAVLVSPFIAPGTLIQEVFDHSAICSTVRRLFAPGTAPLSQREAASLRFDAVPVLANPRAASELPSFGARELPPLVPNDVHEVPASALDDFQQSLVELGHQVQLAVRDERPEDKRMSAFLWWPSAPVTARQFRTVAEADSYQTFVMELVRDE